jgi:hypothetical protein
VTSTPDGGGLVLTSVEVIAIFWGKYWSQTSPPPSPTSDTYYQAFTGIVTGPYMKGLRQYRGVGPGTMLGKFINDTSDPNNGYSDSDVVDMLTKFLDNNSSVPVPTSGHQRFYAVVTPPGLNDNEALGKHVNFTYKGVKAYYCWINSEGGLTDSSSDGVVNTFSHELAEACTDPDGNGILVNGKKADGTPVNNDEIGDTCNNEFAIVEMNGVHCNVQCYWSAADQACILPLGSLSFLINKNSFGKDEVQEALKVNKGVFSNAFWLALDDFSIDTFNSFKVEIPTPTGPFANLAGVTIRPSPATPGGTVPAQPIPIYEDPTNSSVIQRMLFSFDVVFADPLVTPFPSSATTYTLTATFKTNGQTVPGPNSQDTVDFELVPGANPYFSNIDLANASAVSWLSQDLRVFTITQGQSALPGDPAAPVFSSSQTPYAYIQVLLGYLNGATAYTAPSSSDPLNGLPGQTGYETGDSSVTPLDGNGNKNFNFAVARVRLTSNTQGTAGQASNVRVFFRLWVANSCDTDFQPNTTYLSNPAYPSLPTNPLPSSANLPPDPHGQAIRTTPFFATGSTGASDYDPSVSNNNIRTIQIPTVVGQDTVWAYYGCFLDVYDVNNNAQYPGTHHCLVAQIAYDNAPLLFDSGVATNPGNTDKLAQRNLQITLSGNPGPQPTHRIPQAFDTRPSLPYLDANGVVLNQPDELMIDWGNTPVGCSARIYWPDVPAADVLALASRLRGTTFLAAADANTITFRSVKGVTYIPIPSATGKTFAGLFTVDLPLGVTAGQEFNIIIRRISTQQVTNIVIHKPVVFAGSADSTRTWRFATGAFQIKIPVTTEEKMLGPEENTLAILKARLALMSPAYRWYPVLQRYIDYVSARVDGAGGDSGSVMPSLTGAGPGQLLAHKRVVLKIWRQGDVLTDNAHEIEWLERNGWRVAHKEKLLEDPVAGTCEILFLLERDQSAFAVADYPPPVGGGVMKPISLTVPTKLPIFAPTQASIVLTCSATRGRILVRQLDPPSPSTDLVIAPGPAPHSPAIAAGVFTASITRTEVSAGSCLVGIFCINDADPYSPPRDPNDARGYPEAPHAVIRVEAFFVGDSVAFADAGPVAVVNNELVPGGEMRVFYVRFVNKP